MLRKQLDVKDKPFTILKAILNDNKVIRSGNWYVTKDIGYLDQDYNNLDLGKSVLENIASLAPYWNLQEIRRHLNDFLFRKNEEVNTLAKDLSGGEKVRLSLAMIAAKTPKLLLLDEITNNLDLETRQHVIEVLKEYPGSIIVISHDEDFLQEIEIKDNFVI
jgi:ATPase subunit of ABC transporter with duplicated ATPase domains